MRLFLSVAVVTILAVTTLAQQATAPAVKFDTPPTIDGTIDTEHEWTAVPSTSGLFDSQSGQPVPEGAQFWLGYDDKYIYFAAKVEDPDPKSISATEYRTNVGLSGDDYIELMLDPTGSMGEFNSFQVNPKGATSVQLAGGRAAKREWTGEILAKGRITDTGWEVEARIPWQIMKLPGAGTHDLRFNFVRNIARLNRSLTSVYTGAGNLSKTPVWAGVLVPKSAVDRSIKLLPYTYLGYDRDQGGVFNMGLDLKTSITDQIQAVGSINPDFRNIENQILSLDFSRFERLVDETRPFFQEGADYSGSQIFVSQRIPYFDLGLNTYGRIDNKTNFGLIEAVDFQSKDGDHPGTRNNLVGTVTSQMDPTMNVRASVASLEMPGISNEAYLIRASKDIGPLNLFLRNMGTQDSIFGSAQANDAALNWSHHDFNYFADFSMAEKGFLPRLGFAPETDYKGWDAGTNFNRTYPHGAWNDWGYSVNHTDYRHSDGGFYRRETQGSLFGTLRNGLYAVLAADFQNFEGSKDHLYTVQAGIPRGNPYNNVTLTQRWGRLDGFDYRSSTLQSAYRLSNRLQLTASYQVVDYQGFTDQSIVGWNYDLDADRAISGRLVKRRDKVNGYLSYRKAGNRGAEYYLIVGDPNAETFRASIIFKIVVPIQIG